MIIDFHSIAILHVLVSGWDQFVENVLKQEGQLHQVYHAFSWFFIATSVIVTLYNLF